MPDPGTAASALDHVVVVLFENRSFDNVLGHLYGPADGKTFEGVIGKELSNPIPGWAEHGAEREVVPYTVATDMDAPNPDSGESGSTRTPSCSTSSTSRTASSSARKWSSRGTRRRRAQRPPWTGLSPTGRGSGRRVARAWLVLRSAGTRSGRGSPTPSRSLRAVLRRLSSPGVFACGPTRPAQRRVRRCHPSRSNLW